MDNYAIINELTGKVVNTVVLGKDSEWLPPDGCIAVQSNIASIGWSYIHGEFMAPEITKEYNPVLLAASVRAQRDMLLERVYDRGVSMVKRALRMETEEKTISSLNEKLAELDKYAKDLQNIPEQNGFPQDVKWPTQPEAEL